LLVPRCISSSQRQPDHPLSPVSGEVHRAHISTYQWALPSYLSMMLRSASLKGTLSGSILCGSCIAVPRLMMGHSHRCACVLQCSSISPELVIGWRECFLFCWFNSTRLVRLEPTFKPSLLERLRLVHIGNDQSVISVELICMSFIARVNHAWSVFEETRILS